MYKFYFFFFFVRINCFKTCALKRVWGVLTWFSKGSPSSMGAQSGYEDFLMNDVRKFSSHLHQSFRYLKLLLTKSRRIIIAGYMVVSFRQAGEYVFAPPHLTLGLTLDSGAFSLFQSI